MQDHRPDPSSTRPAVVAHADWSTHPKKRWMAVAVLEAGRYVAHAPQSVGDVATLLERLSLLADGACVLAGFDFPIGIPAAYAERAGIRDFREVLPQLGRGEWSRFYDVAGSREEIGVRRPFYPRSSLPKGSTKRQHLIDGLGVASMSELLRRCDRAQGGRREAASIFWLVGGNQVGKAAISGWREVLVPALRSPNVALWPFDGTLDELLASKRAVIAETYPAEFYDHLGLRFGSKTRQEDRAAAPTLLRWAEDNAVTPTTEMRAAIREGFGSGPVGEDRFDAAVGLFGMLGVVLGNRPAGEPDDPSVKMVEGWMFGQLGASTGRARTPRNIPLTTPDEPRAEGVATHPAEYDPLADLYDLEYVHDYDVGFWLSVAGGQPGPVVEWGAGTGRIAVPLSRAGHYVTAVELSGRMAERGREKGAGVEWVVGDMRSAKLWQRFGLAVCAFNSLLCLPTAEDVLAFLRNAREHLLPGGLLGIEVSAFSPEELADTADGVPLQHDFTQETPDGWLDRFSASRYDATSRVMQMRLFYELYTDDGELETRRAHDLAIRITDYDELRSLLREAGFRVESVYGGFEWEPFTAASDHLIVLSQRADLPTAP